MTAPRIGDTVHYTPNLGEHTCRAAIIFNIARDGSVAINVWDPAGTQYGTTAHEDPNARHDGHLYDTNDRRTPGTWHHIH